MSIANKIHRILGCKSNIKRAIEAKGVTVGDANFDQYSDKIWQIQAPNVEAPENDVNFYDYDGYRVASYTIEEAKALTELPTPPAHEGLTFQEWNWTLSDIQSYDRQYINVGANYITSDGKTHIFIQAEAGEEYSIKIIISKTLTINWGDGNTETTTGAVTISHTYPNAGDYEVVLSSNVSAGSTYSFVELLYDKHPCIHMVKEFRCGNDITISGAYTFRYYACKLSISTNSLTSMNAGNFALTKIPMVVVPRNCTTATSSIGFNYYNGEVSLPHYLNKPGETSYFYNLNAKRIVIPECDSSYTAPGNYFNSSPFIEIVSLPLSFKWASAVTYGNFTSMNNLRGIDIVQGWVPNVNLKIDGNNKLTATSMVDFFNKLGETASSITLTFGTSNLNKLTATQKAIATSKGYTLA